MLPVKRGRNSDEISADPAPDGEAAYVLELPIIARVVASYLDLPSRSAFSRTTPFLYGLLCAEDDSLNLMTMLWRETKWISIEERQRIIAQTGSLECYRTMWESRHGDARCVELHLIDMVASRGDDKLVRYAIDRFDQVECTVAEWKDFYVACIAAVIESSMPDLMACGLVRATIWNSRRIENRAFGIACWRLAGGAWLRKKNTLRDALLSMVPDSLELTTKELCFRSLELAFDRNDVVGMDTMWIYARDHWVAEEARWVEGILSDMVRRMCIAFDTVSAPILEALAGQSPRQMCTLMQRGQRKNCAAWGKLVEFFDVINPPPP